jgi:hypothetical protein
MPAKIKIPPLSVVWVTTSLFALIESWFWWMYNYKWFDRESIAFLATITAGAFALFVYLKGIEEKRSQAADKLIERWNAPSFRVIIDATRAIVEGDKDSSELGRPKYALKTASATDTALRGNMQTVLGFFEEIAISVIVKTADEEKLRRFFEAVIPAGYDGFEAFILAEREIDKDPAIYKECQKLVERWTDVRRRDMP